jgi:predicted Ser/Thr protein kinase
MGCDNISKISFDIDDDLLKDLKRFALKTNSNYLDLVESYIQKGLKNQTRGNDMVSVTLDDNVVEKVKIKCRLSNKTPEDVVNDILWDNLRKLEDYSDDFDGDRIWNLLEHDKPEWDDILDRITDMFD